MLVLKGHDRRQAVYSLAFAPDGAALASCGLDDTVRLWDLRAGTHRVVAKTYGYLARSVAFSPDGATLAWVNHDDVHTCDLATDERHEVHTAALLRSEREGESHRLIFAVVRYSPDGKMLAVAGTDLHLLEVGTWQTWRRQAPDERKIAYGIVTGSVAFAPDGRRLAVGVSRPGRKHAAFYRHAVHLFEPARLEHLGAVEAAREVTDLAFAPDGVTLAAACGPVLTVWDVAHPRPLLQHQFGNRHVKSVAFTPDGRFLLVAGNDSSVRVRDARSWAEHTAFDWGIGEVVTVAVAADGMRAAAGGHNGKIVVWDLDL
jgi:WD40 repeat protein